jgi:hypothetical protein
VLDVVKYTAAQEDQSLGTLSRHYTLRMPEGTSEAVAKAIECLQEAAVAADAFATPTQQLCLKSATAKALGHLAISASTNDVAAALATLCIASKALPARQLPMAIDEAFKTAKRACRDAFVLRCVRDIAPEKRRNCNEFLQAASAAFGGEIKAGFRNHLLTSFGHFFGTDEGSWPTSAHRTRRGQGKGKRVPIDQTTNGGVLVAMEVGVVTEEEWQHRIAKRRESIDKIKTSSEYCAYSARVPVEQRGIDEPVTPAYGDRSLSTRKWKYDVKQWHLSLRARQQGIDGEQSFGAGGASD